MPRRSPKPQTMKHAMEIGKHGSEGRGHLIGRNGKLSGRRSPYIEKHPAGHGYVEHHEQVAAHNTQPAHTMPGRSLRFQDPERIAEILLRSSSHGKFHDKQRQGKQEQKKQIGDHKDRSAVFSRNIGKPPYIAQSYGTSGGNEKKADTTGHFLTLHDLLRAQGTSLAHGLVRKAMRQTSITKKV